MDYQGQHEALYQAPDEGTTALNAGQVVSCVVAFERRRRDGGADRATRLIYLGKALSRKERPGSYRVFRTATQMASFVLGPELALVQA